MTGRREDEGRPGDIASRIAALSPEKRALLEARLGSREAANVAQRPGPSRDAPLSFAQERIHRLVRADPESSFFVSITRLRLPPAVEVSTLRRALAFLAERHEALRTELRVERDEPALAVRDAPADPLIVADPGGAERLVAEAARAVRSLAPPLFRAIASAVPEGGQELTLVTHAIACDAPSLGLLWRELLAACEALGRGSQPDLPPVRTKPADHAREQRRRLHGARVERLVERWRPLERAPSCLALHTDRPRAPKRLPEVARCRRGVAGDLVLRASAAAGALGVSAASLWSAVSAIVLGRFARQTQVVLGVQVANREREELRGFVGVAANVVPVSVDLGADSGLRAIAAGVEAELKAAAAGEDLPYEKLVQELRLQRSDRHNPLLQVVLAARSALEPSPPGPAWFGGGSALFDLAIAVDDASPAPGLELLYNAHLFEEEAVQSIARALEAVVDAALERPDAPASSLPLLRPAEREDAQPATVSPPAFASTIHGLFERCAALDPDRIALEGDEAISYAELNARANRLARALLTRGVKPGDTVGVCMKRSAELVVSFLAVLKAGAVYLPLDPQYPAERLAFMVKDSGTRLILHRGGVPDEAPLGCETADIASLDAAAHSASNLEAGDPSGLQAAYLMYTSGSTGRPKGVLVQHLGVCHVADAQVARFDLTPGERILQFASPSFDASIFELVMAPRCGGALHLARAEDLMPGPPLVQLLKARRITVLTIPPSALGALAPIELPDLRIVISAGEACPAELVSRWAPGRRFFNAYGPTEGSIWATVMECAPAERPPPIGRPLPHVRARVVDELSCPVPDGAPGELLLGGPGVALGYLNRPELTSERFLAAAPGDPDGRWYRTGDVVRRDSAGCYWHLGRLDRQLKVRGFRIEPGEIESCLLEHPGVRSAAVEVELSNLVAFYVADAPIDAAALQRWLSRRLPRHMVPTTLVALQAMPLGANGKLDRAALHQQARPRTAGLQPPRTETEKTLVEIWKSVLRIDKVGIGDNFFDLGGHSLLAASVLSRASAALGREIPLRVMFRCPTIAQLAEAFDSAEPAPEESLS